jgi:hypothetical protein
MGKKDRSRTFGKRHPRPQIRAQPSRRGLLPAWPAGERPALSWSGGASSILRLLASVFGSFNRHLPAISSKDHRTKMAPASKNVIPVEREKLARPQACVQRQDIHGREVVGGRGCEEGTGLVTVQTLHLAARYPGEFDEPGDIAADLLQADSVFESSPQRLQRLVLLARGLAVRAHAGKQVTDVHDVHWSEVAKEHSAHVGRQVQPNPPLIPDIACRRTFGFLVASHWSLRESRNRAFLRRLLPTHSYTRYHSRSP